MKANELRVGNIVKKNKVEYVADFIAIQMAHNYNPILLTPEILEECGFIVDEDGDFLKEVIKIYSTINPCFNIC